MELGSDPWLRRCRLVACRNDARRSGLLAQRIFRVGDVAAQVGSWLFLAGNLFSRFSDTGGWSPASPGDSMGAMSPSATPAYQPLSPAYSPHSPSYGGMGVSPRYSPSSPSKIFFLFKLEFIYSFLLARESQKCWFAYLLDTSFVLYIKYFSNFQLEILQATLRPLRPMGMRALATRLAVRDTARPALRTVQPVRAIRRPRLPTVRRGKIIFRAVRRRL